MINSRKRLLLWLKIFPFNFIFDALAIVATEMVLRYNYEKIPLKFYRFIPHQLRIKIAKDPSKIIKLGKKPHDSMGYVYYPGQVFKKKNELGQLVEFRANADGFYTPSNPTVKEKQIITIGDSFMAIQENLEPIAWKIQKNINLPVYNMALGGWGVEQYIEAFKIYGINRDAQHVLVFTYENDVKDVLIYQEWKKANRYGLEMYRRVKAFKRWKGVNKSNTWLDNHSLIYNYIKWSFAKKGIRYKTWEKPYKKSDRHSFTGKNGSSFKLLLKR
jgi:hypothetical protein